MTFFRACIAIVAALFVATFLFNARQEFFGPANPGWTPAGLTMRVAAIRTGSPMSDAGLRAGDIIESIDGRPLTGMAGWFVARAHFRIGRAIQIGVRRGGLLFETRFVITREAWRFWLPSHFAAVCAFYAARLILLLSGLFLAFRRPLVAWMLMSISVAEGYPSAGWADSLTRLPAPLAVAICLAAAAWLLGAFA
jgi:hypothetical protein